MEGTTKAELVLNNVEKHLIPALENEAELIHRERIKLGLQHNQHKGSWEYPERLSPEKAYLRARDIVGGDKFVIARKELRLMDAIYQVGIAEMLSPQDPKRKANLREEFRHLAKEVTIHIRRFQQEAESLKAYDKQLRIKQIVDLELKEQEKLQTLRAPIEQKFKENCKVREDLSVLKDKLTRLSGQEIKVSYDKMQGSELMIPSLKSNHIEQSKNQGLNRN